MVVTDSTGQSTGQKAKCDFGTRTFFTALVTAAICMKGVWGEKAFLGLDWT